MSERTPSSAEAAGKSVNTFPVMLIVILVAILMGWAGISYNQESQVQDYGETPRPNANMMQTMPSEYVLDTFSDGNRTAPGQTQIKVVPAIEVDLPEETPIIGVIVDGQARAYLPKGMSEPQSHLAHDNIKGQPITVTYCNWTDCARVFTRGSVSPEEIRMGGFQYGQMQLVIKNKLYDHNSTQLPINEYPMERVTWGEWKAAHPETGIYLGDQAQKE